MCGPLSGRIIEVKDPNGNISKSEYNALDLLTKTITPSPFEYVTNFSYDKIGNRLSMKVDDANAHEYTYDNLYQLTDVNYNNGINDIRYFYDKIGNRTSVINGGTTSYVHNCLNQYTAVGSTTTKYCYDGDQVIAEYEGGTLARKYIYGPGIDEPICVVVSGVGTYYYHFDGLVR